MSGTPHPVTGSGRVGGRLPRHAGTTAVRPSHTGYDARQAFTAFRGGNR
ncbi:hypothetical protein ACWCPT_26200 [Streptomyces sp. NPDC002308]